MKKHEVFICMIPLLGKNKQKYTDLSVNSYRSLEDTMHSQDGRLWRVDDGRTEHRSKHTTVTDGKCASVHVFNG